MKPICLFTGMLLVSLNVVAQNQTSTPPTFRSNSLRLNTRPLFAAKKAPGDEKKESATTTKAPANWRTTNEYRFADHFVATDWQKINGNVFTETVKGDQCRIRMTQTDRPGLYVIDMPFDFKQNNFQIDVVVEERATLPLAGLVYGLVDKDNYYSFLINSRGEYQVDGILEGESLGLMPRFAKSSAINVKGPNTLQIDKKGSQVQYLINGQKVYENRFINFADNKIGYYAQSSEVSFRNFAVSLLKK